MNNKIILDLCGGTGSWSEPYKEAGYDVRIITLPEHDVCTYEPPKNVYGILAAPPCTEFSIAKGSSLRDFETALQVVDACIKIVWKCRMDGTLRFWALENPRGYLRQFLGIPKFTFEHWHYDKDAEFVKATDVWGYFNIPKQSNFMKPELEYHARHGKLYGSPKAPSKYKDYLNTLPYLQRRAAIRAITPTGFAQAFYNKNK